MELPRRSLLLPSLVIILVALALAVILRGQPLQACQLPLTATCALANLLSAGAALARAREVPEEARGWNRLAGALGALALANLAAGFTLSHPGLPVTGNAGPVLLGLLSQGLSCWAVLAMPWHRSDRRAGTRNLLGTVLFVGSILLILWTLVSWEKGFRVHNIANLALVAACGRLVVLGGLTLFLVEQNPRRVHGFLGYLLAYVMLGAGYIALLQLLLARGVLQVPSFASLFALSPLLLGLAAWTRAPMESPARSDRNPRFWLFLPYATFAVAALAFLLKFLLTRKVETVPLLSFLGLTWLLLYRQFLLLKELRTDNHSLEDRVADRTRALEAMQTVVLRTERLNTMASLGAGLAHDLNNFLCVISASAHMVRKNFEAGSLPEARHLERIQLSTDRATALTTRLMGFARKDPTPAATLDLGEELARLEDLLRMLLPPTIPLLVEVAQGAYPVFTRRASLEQILVNLVANAKDAMPEGGQVTIRLDSIPGPEGPLAEIQVEDNGPGLPPSVLDHLFEYFVTTKPEGKGTGLGLATVKALVTADRGTVSVQSCPGDGCTFLLAFPMAMS